MRNLILVILSLLTLVQGSESNDVRKTLWQWWTQEASLAKPLKCRLNPAFNEPYPQFINEKFFQEEQRAVVFRSRFCREKEESNFDFKGEIVDGKFEGPGKLKIKKKSKKDKFATEEIVDNNVCLDLFNQQIVEIIGTFKNGVLHGPGKLVLNGKGFIIGHFNNGGFAGLVREFDTNSTLETMQYIDIQQKGDTWGLNGKYLVYRPSQNMYRPKVLDFDTIYIPLNDTEEIYAGLQVGYSGHEHLTNVHSVQLESLQLDFCMPQFKIKVIQKQPFDIENLNRKLKPFDMKKSLCQRVQSGFQELMDHFDANEFGSPSLLYQVKPETSQVEENKVKQAFMSNVKVFVIDSNIKINMSIWNGPICTWTWAHGGFDENLHLNGFSILKLDKSFHNQSGSHDFLNWSPAAISGHFKHGKLEGIARIDTFRGQAILATFKDGVLHGPAVLYGAVAILDIEARGFQRSTLYKPHASSGVAFIGTFKNGQVAENFWVKMKGDGWLHGQVDDNGLITGHDIAYIYPDGETAFKGHFENRVMKKAFNVDVLKYGCDANGLLKVEEFSHHLSDHVFFYDPPTNVSFGGGFQDYVRDPYEVKTVQLAQSKEPNSGQGVFLLKDLPKGRFACMYSLFLYRTPDQSGYYKANCWNNNSKSDDYRRHCKKYSLGLSTYGAYIDVPPEYDVNPLPNLGPKVNHHFSASNSGYKEIEHPRWGSIQSVTLLQDLKAGQELFTNYGYGKSDFPEDFPWYFEAKLQLEREQRLKQEEQDKASKSKKKNKKNKTKKN